MPTQIDEMREKRIAASSIFMKFASDLKNHETYAFCFFEGEDAKYYNSRISAVFGDAFITYTAGNKHAVLKVMERITADPLYSSVCVMFFVDRDYDESMDRSNDDLFETPCYSIENLYVQESVLDKVLKAEFGMNPLDKDFQKCIDIYKKRYKEFVSTIIPFDALAYYKHRYRSDACCSFDIKTSQLAKITIDNVQKASKHDQVVSELKNALGVDSTMLSQIINELSLEKCPELVFRGKNQLDFFVEMLKLFKQKNAEGTFFDVKYRAVKLNITKNRLSELSQYAVTPEKLSLFLKAHKGYH